MLRGPRTGLLGRARRRREEGETRRATEEVQGVWPVLLALVTAKGPLVPLLALVLVAGLIGGTDGFTHHAGEETASLPEGLSRSRFLLVLRSEQEERGSQLDASITRDFEQMEQAYIAAVAEAELARQGAEGGAPVYASRGGVSLLWADRDNDVVAIVCGASYIWPCDWATATVMCESGGDPYAHGHEWYQGHYWHFLGLFQIAVPDHIGNDWLYDLALNTVEAHLKYVSGGTGHWPNCG